MQYQEKNGTKGLIVLLVLMIGFVTYQFVILPLLNKDKVEDEKKETKEEISLEELGEKLYNKFTLDIGEEYGITSSDDNLLTTKLSIYKMSDHLKLTLGFKNIDEEYITKDNGYKMKDAITNMNGNFYYGGNYIMAEAVEKSMDNIFGPVPVKHQTVTLRDTKYVYDRYHNLYEIWILRDEQEYTEEKITYSEVVAKEEEILVYEYVAYTDYRDLDNITTRTNSSKNVGVVITEDNVKDLLSYMDKYKYIFKKNKDGNYYFVGIEFMYE